MYAIFTVSFPLQFQERVTGIPDLNLLNSYSVRTTYRSVEEENRDSTYKRSCWNKGAQDHTQASTNLHKTKRRCNQFPKVSNVFRLSLTNNCLMSDIVVASSLLLQ